MTLSSWHSLTHEKYRLSLRLFLILNALSATFSMISPLYHVHYVAPPILLIGLLSSALLVVNGLNKKAKIDIRIIAFLFGSLWAWHIANKSGVVPDFHSSYIMIALLSVLFIGAIAFTHHLSAFALHSLPVFCTVMWIDRGEHWLQVLYSLIVPVAGIAIQHRIQTRNDSFAQGLMAQLIQEKARLNDLSMLDPLTGLYNRRGFDARFDTLLASGSKGHHLLLLDIDHFKAYNDHYGHMMGDQALIRVSAAIRDAVRSRDIVVRYGGEEFLVIITSTTPELARDAAERIRQRVYDLRIPHMFNHSVATHVTVSIGLAPLTEEGIEAALEKADRALYSAKHRGRNHILTSDDVKAA
ncbi:GGDEF domain-containing protein [Siccibacter colletis]|uniref:diguanylate cyclase n=1 Tax=Siccibacter colletis TaxID=1505757 RepID=A0ABY6JG43_9ENTR|nr:GGDEF domain-containing protein [Siccibacter colletis]UYU31431.1 GGDEF domain-containing protein [Siccibacter colletis]